ncbi:MAG: PilZ domain-containing protein [Sphingomicrobium sp.]
MNLPQSNQRSTFDRPVRKAVELLARVVLNDERCADATLLDLSYNGCAIACDLDLQIGTLLTLQVAELGNIKAHVRWASLGKLGLFFSKVPELTNLRPRAHDRVAIDGEIIVRRRGGAGFATSILDVSPVGCRIDFVERPRVGEKLWVKFPGFESLDAFVRWTESYTGGIEFVRPIYPSVFDLLLLRLDAPMQDYNDRRRAGV